MAQAEDQRVLPGRVRWALVVGLILLSPVCAEYLIGYDESIGDPVALVAGLFVLGPLYGAVAVLIREAVRRAGRGWPAILVLGAALGLVQAGLIDQSLFGLEFDASDPAWAREQAGAPIPGIGVDAAQLVNFVGGHMTWSFAAPIAVVESLAPRAAAARPWLGRPGILAMIVLYLLGAAAILGWVEKGGTGVQLLGAGLVAAALVGLAFAVPRRGAVPRSGRVPPTWVVGAVTFVLLAVTQLVPGTWGWLGVGCAVAALGGLAALLWSWSRHPAWGRRQVLAVAGAALLVRATLAFLVEPLGEVSYPVKYGVNAVILIMVCGLLALAARRLRRPTPS